MGVLPIWKPYNHGMLVFVRIKHTRGNQFTTGSRPERYRIRARTTTGTMDHSERHLRTAEGARPHQVCCTPDQCGDLHQLVKVSHPLHCPRPCR